MSKPQNRIGKCGSKKLTVKVTTRLGNTLLYVEKSQKYKLSLNGDLIDTSEDDSYYGFLASQIPGSSPQNILVLGAGVGNLTESLLNVFPSSKIFDCELDEDMYRLCRLLLRNRSGSEAVFGDAYKIVCSDVMEGKVFDAIFFEMDTRYVPSTSKLQNLFQACRLMLRDQNSVFVSQTGPVGNRDEKSKFCKVFRSVFSQCEEVVCSEVNWTFLKARGSSVAN